jgi:hypothetical protein
MVVPSARERRATAGHSPRREVRGITCHGITGKGIWLATRSLLILSQWYKNSTALAYLDPKNSVSMSQRVELVSGSSIIATKI